MRRFLFTVFSLLILTLHVHPQQAPNIRWIENLQIEFSQSSQRSEIYEIFNDDLPFYLKIAQLDQFTEGSDHLLSLAIVSQILMENRLWEDAYHNLIALNQMVYSSALNFLLSYYYYYHLNDLDMARFHWVRARAWQPISTRWQEIKGFLAREFAFQRFDSIDTTLEDPNISVIFQDRDDIWIGSWNGGLVRYSHTENTSVSFFESRESIFPITVRSLTLSDPILYVGTFNGLYRYHKSRDEWKKIEPPEDLTLERIQNLVIWNGTLLVGSLGGGLWSWKNDTWTQPFSNSQLDYISTLAIDPQNNLWIGTLNRGVFRFTEETGFLEKISGFPDNVTFFYWDNHESLWMGTYGNGLFQYSNNQLLNYTKENTPGFPDNWILSFAEGTEGMYFGTFGGGLVFYDGEWRTHSEWSRFSTSDISSLSYFDNQLILGTLGEGMFFWNEEWDNEK